MSLLIKAAGYPGAGEQAFLDADHTKLDGIDTDADVTGANPPQAHGASVHTDRTRKIWCPCLYATDGIAAGGIGWHVYGVMNDAKDTHAYSSIKVPEDYVSGGSIYAVIVPKGTGNIVYTIGRHAAADGEAYNTHSRGTAGTIEAVTTDEIEILDDPVDAQSIAAGDFIGIRLVRDGDNASDTVDAAVYCLGFIFVYTADM